ncbi:MAG TPA: glycosyltransferase family 2 protein [Isosphaeraceae bacterium]|jgi:hypothetical protein
MSAARNSDGGGPAPGAPLLHVIILNWRRWRDTIACLDSVFGSDYPNFRVVVCDNDSQDGSLARIRDWAAGRPACPVAGPGAGAAPPAASGCVPKPIAVVEAGPLEPGTPAGAQEHDTPLILIQTGENRGFSGGCNVGIAEALARGADYVFLLNNDAVAETATFRHLLAVARQSGAAIVGARLQQEFPDAGHMWPALLFGGGAVRRGAGDDEAFWATNLANGCAMLIRRDLLVARFAECGYYLDPDYFMYLETEDLALYAGARGYGCVIARDAVVHHAIAQSSGGKFNPRSFYYFTRNRILLANRWLDARWKLLFHAYYIPSRLLLLTLGVRRWRWRTVQAVGSGLIDGYLGGRGKWKHH